MWGLARKESRSGGGAHQLRETWRVKFEFLVSRACYSAMLRAKQKTILFFEASGRGLVIAPSNTTLKLKGQCSDIHTSQRLSSQVRAHTHTRAHAQCRHRRRRRRPPDWTADGGHPSIQ